MSYTPTPINYHGREGYKEGHKSCHSKKKKKKEKTCPIPSNNYNVTVCFVLKPTSTFFSTFFFFFFLKLAIVDFVNGKQCICILFTVPQITLFNNFFIKNGSHNTIYTFKNYFATMFSVSIFSFSKNKLNPNGL